MPRATLERQVKRFAAGASDIGRLGRAPTLGEQAEKELVELLELHCKAGYPYDVPQLLELVYSYCEANNLPHMFNRDNKAAGRKLTFLMMTPKMGPKAQILLRL